MDYQLSDIEVPGHGILSFMDALQFFQSIGKSILNQEKIGKLVDGNYVIEPDVWYPMENMLTILQIVKAKTGPNTLKQVGYKTPENVQFPPDIDSIHKAIQSINIAYHLNHRKAGIPMFNQATGQMTGGIGHYGYEAVPNSKKIISVCANPYPSEYDEGILQAMARKFEANAMVKLDETQPSRRKGDKSCTFIITW